MCLGESFCWSGLDCLESLRISERLADRQDVITPAGDRGQRGKDQL